MFSPEFTAFHFAMAGPDLLAVPALQRLQAVLPLNPTAADPPMPRRLLTAAGTGCRSKG